MSEDEYEPKPFSYEVVEGLKPDVFAQLRGFLSQEMRKREKLSEAQRSESRYRDHMLTLVVSGNGTLDEIEQNSDLEKSFAVIARSEDEIIGFGIVGVDTNNKVRETFGGVSWDHARQGVALELIKQNHQILLARGIHEYQITVHEGSKAAMQKAVRQPLVPVPGDETGRRFIVKLK
jgi:hypothetical protein